MTVDKKSTYVVDSCCVISLLTNDHPERIPHLQRLFEDAERQNCTLILPTVARLEILGTAPQQASSGYPPRRQKQFDRAREWLDSRPFLTSELDDFTVSRSHDLIRDHSLGGIDAAIIATALVHEASKVLTYDRPMLAAGPSISGLSVESPSGALWEDDLFSSVLN